MENTSPKKQSHVLAVALLVVLAIVGLLIWQQYSDALSSKSTGALITNTTSSASLNAPGETPLITNK